MFTKTQTDCSPHIACYNYGKHKMIISGFDGGAGMYITTCDPSVDVGQKPMQAGCGEVHQTHLDAGRGLDAMNRSHLKTLILITILDHSTCTFVVRNLAKTTSPFNHNLKRHN